MSEENQVTEPTVHLELDRAPVTPMTDSCSDQLDKLFTALAKAQGDLGPALTNKFNEFFKHGYADLGACLNAMREPLSKNGLSLVQIPMPVENKLVSLKTILGHTSGQFITSTFSVMMAKDTPQEFGLVLTYLRRYAACSMVGVAQEDNDADTQRNISDEQIDHLMQLADELFGKEANKQLTRISKLFSVKDVSGLLSGNFDAAVNNLNQIARSEQKKAEEAAELEKEENNIPPMASENDEGEPERESL